MFKLNKNLELALKTVEFLGTQKDKVIRIQDVAQRVGSSTAFLEQIVRKLNVAGVTKSVRGPGGGIKINTEKTVTALNVANALGYQLEANDGIAGDLTKQIETVFASRVVS